MNQEEVEVARETLVANIFVVGGLALLFIGSSITAILAYRDYQKSLTAAPQPIQALPTV